MKKVIGFIGCFFVFVTFISLPIQAKDTDGGTLTIETPEEDGGMGSYMKSISPKIIPPSSPVSTETVQVSVSSGIAVAEVSKPSPAVVNEATASDPERRVFIYNMSTDVITPFAIRGGRRVQFPNIDPGRVLPIRYKAEVVLYQVIGHKGAFHGNFDSGVVSFSKKSFAWVYNGTEMTKTEDLSILPPRPK